MAGSRFLMVALAAAVAVTSAQTCPPTSVPVVTGTGPLTFAVIGDWGRLGALKSITPLNNGGFDATGYCVKNFNDTATIEEANVGAVAQLTAAKAMGWWVAKTQSSFVINTGDNFYECGVDTPLRLDLDWNRVYGGCGQNPSLAGLKWYNTIGNHDVPLTSVQAQLDYAKFEPRWVFPCRYYAVDYVYKQADGSSIKARIAYINTNPFVTKYSKPTNKYYGTEINQTATPAAISAQLDWLNATLASSDADWIIVVGHHPAASGAATVYGPFASQVTDPGSETDAGKPDLNGTPSWTRLRDIMTRNKVDLYFNGHDHILSHTVDPIDPVNAKTQYVTTGAGALGDPADGCGVNKRSYVKWVGAKYTNSSCAGVDGTASVGFNVVKLWKKKAEVNYFALYDYKSSKSYKAYSFAVPAWA